MGRRDLLSNTIYQRMKQLQSRLKKRNQEEEKRQERAERAKTARWEEHQRQILQFENYLKRCSRASKRQRVPPDKTSAPPNTATGSTPCSGAGINLEQVHLVETTYETRSYSSGTTSTTYRRSPALSLPLTQTGTDQLTSTTCPIQHSHLMTTTVPSVEHISVQSHLPSPPSPPTTHVVDQLLHQVTETEEKSLEQDWYQTDWQDSPISPNFDKFNGKSDLAKGLEELDDISARHDLTTPKSMTSDHACSAVLSPPPTLPSTPTGSGSMLLQTPIPLHETPVIPIISDRPSPSPEVPLIPEIAISKMDTASTEGLAAKAKGTKKPKMKKKGKKKGQRNGKGLNSKNSIETNTQVELLKVENTDTSQSRREAQKKIKEIFTSVNTLPEEELTEEAFDVFLDTIKKLSEYIDKDDIDSQNFEIVDDLSSGFSSRANEYLAEDSSGATNKMFGDITPTPTPDFQHGDDPVVKPLTAAQLKRKQADEKRRQRILVVREKQAGIIMYRKVTMAELRLRRQRALMRVRLKLIDESNERDKVHLQRVRLLEMAHLNEKERLARLEQFKMEEERRLLEEAEIKRMKELKVKEELELLLERSRKRQAEEERLARLDRLRREQEEQGKENESAVPENKEESIPDSEDGRRNRLQRNWKKAARRARNKEKFENMIQQNSQVLYRALVKELISQRQKSLIADVPGFSYFLLLKYTLDLEDIADIMSDLG